MHLSRLPGDSKITLAVVFGGRSVEHEVSIITGYQAIEALDRRKYEILPVYIARDNVWYVGEALADISFFRRENPPLGSLTRVFPAADAARGKLRLIPAFRRRLAKYKAIVIDFVLPATHGSFGEDGCLQGLLEMAGVPFVGSGVAASAVGMDKLLTKAVLKRHGLPLLPYLQFSSGDWKTADSAAADRVVRDLSFPVFVKPASLGSSVGVACVDSADALIGAVEFAFRFGERVLVESALVNASEVNCSVIDGDPPIPSILEQPVKGNTLLTFDEKYGGGKKGAAKGFEGMAGQPRIIPAPFGEVKTAEIQRLAVKTFMATGAGGVARVDLLIAPSGEIYVNEINNIPGSFSYYLWEHMGKSFRELLDYLVKRASEVNHRRNRRRLSFDSNLLGSPGLV